ncbi:hypothetical protein [Salinithrix halophila]|uniref:SAF domain-containing protein n=1 Tax=Salinithrix halophila TaxID=1485204 RepID=A0ABV8JAV1_9BACL
MQDAKRRAMIFAMLSVVLAAIAAYYFLEQSNQLEAGLGDERVVLVAKKNIKSREPLKPEYFEEMPVPERYAKSNQVSNPSQLEGQVSVVALGKGDQLTTNVLRPITQLDDPSKRLVLLRASNRVLFDELFNAQDRVDIVVSYEKEGGGTTELLMNDKLVYSVAQGNKAVGLELNLKEAQALIKAENFAHSIRVIKAPQKKNLSKRARQRNQQPNGTNPAQQQSNGQTGQGTMSQGNQ